MYDNGAQSIYLHRKKYLLEFKVSWGHLLTRHIFKDMIYSCKVA